MLKKTNNQNLENSISDIFSEELFNPTIDLSIDYTEIYIDDLINNDLIKEIPIVKSIVALIKTGISINQLFFTKKILAFIKEFNSGSVVPEKLEDFKTQMNSDLSFRKKVIEQIMVINDRFIQLQQSMICAQLFKAYVNGSFNYEEYVNLCIFLERLHPKTYKFMQTIEAVDFFIDQNYKDKRDWEIESTLLSSGLGTEPSDFWSGFKLSQDGVRLYKFGIKPLLK